MVGRRCSLHTSKGRRSKWENKIQIKKSSTRTIYTVPKDGNISIEGRRGKFWWDLVKRCCTLLITIFFRHRGVHFILIASNLQKKNPTYIRITSSRETWVKSWPFFYKFSSYKHIFFNFPSQNLPPPMQFAGNNYSKLAGLFFPLTSEPYHEMMPKDFLFFALRPFVHNHICGFLIYRVRECKT